MNQEQIEQEELLSINSDKFPCPGCGAFMVYSPKTQGLTCEYCGSQVDIKEDNRGINEFDFNSDDDLSDHNWTSEKRAMKCNACGGETVIAISDLSGECAFCGSAHVVVEEMTTGIPPGAIIPFKMPRQEAKDKINKWVGGKFFAPKDLKNLKKLDRLNSIYIPYFTYDSNTYTFFSAKRGDHYYVTKTVMKDGERKTVRERRTRWTHVDGVYDHFFDDILVHASNKVDQDLVEKMHSFDLTALVPFQEAYLSGHASERYTKSLNTGWHEAQGVMNSRIESGIRQQVGGDEFRLISSKTNYNNPTFKYISLPVWITNYVYKEKVFDVYVNGQTGRVVGEYPKSWVKVSGTILAFVLLSLIIYAALVNGG